MKVLTLHQPWASLVAFGVKTIEPRRLSTAHRGPLAIHAAARKPRRIWVSPNDDPPAVVDQIAMGRYYEIGEDINVPGQWCYDWSGPLGAIVATCTLADVVPIVDCSEACGPCLSVMRSPYPLALFHTDGVDEEADNVEDQRPYGDFTPGRFAWLLADVEPVDPPVPFKTWTEA